MAALSNLSDLINRATGGSTGTPETSWFFKVPRISGTTTTVVAGRHSSLWNYDGFPGTGAIPPSTATAPTNLTAGALPFTNPGTGREKHLIQFWGGGLNGGTLILYDRLMHIAGLSGTVTTAQTVGGTLTRNTTGASNFAFIEIGVAIGTTGTTVRMTYTNSAGTTGRLGSLVSIGGTGFREQARAIMLPLAAGDTGIQVIESVQLTASTGTAGNIGVVLCRPIAYCGLGGAGLPGWRDYVTGLPGIPKIESGSCLALLWIPTSGTAPDLMGGLAMVEA